MNVLTDKTFKSDVLASKTPVLVDFYADWCGPCKMLGPVLDELSKDADFDGKLKFAKISTEDYPELSQSNNVQGIPCLIIFKNGKEAGRVVGYAPKPVMKSKILNTLASI